MRIFPGKPDPLGTACQGRGINFAIHAKNVKTMSLLIYNGTDRSSPAEIPLDDVRNKSGNIWHVLIEDLPDTFAYNYKLLRRSSKMYILNDPYARLYSGRNIWGTEDNLRPVYRCHHIDDNFDWEGDLSPRIPLSETIIYEVHTRGFTRHPSAKVQSPGTFRGLVEKIPYLLSLGITTIELLPVFEFDEMSNQRKNPETGRRLVNYWGYDPLGYFAPKSAYACHTADAETPIREFKEMVKALHRAGIEIILDVVYNHTGEGPVKGPTYSFRGLDESSYYMVGKHRHYHNFSGCGNTFNCNHPLVQDLIIHSLRYWVEEMHVDGFRFDLASILSRDGQGSVLSSPPVLEKINKDPVLSNMKLIAEAWDAAGLYQVGSFPGGKRWAEWNDKFRNTIRRYIRGDEGVVPELATRIAGSSDLFQHSQRTPAHSINFITAHDGFTLNDLVSYNRKRNRMNGENNRDGADENFSFNYGVEGPTSDEKVNRQRLKQMKNMACLLFLSQGTPMMIAGDEFGRTQRGNNNPYCQDNEISWIDWQLVDKNADLLRFFKLLIAFRKAHPALRREKFFESNPAENPEIIWYNADLEKPNWFGRQFSLAFHLTNHARDTGIYIITSSEKKSINFRLPDPGKNMEWVLSLDTSKDSPFDILPAGEELRLDSQRLYPVEEQSTVVLIGLKR